MKKLLFFLFLFCILQNSKASEVLDVTSQYMTNYAAPFLTTGENLINGNVRWQKLSAPWVTSGNVSNAIAGDSTMWHVDAQKKSQLAFPADPATYPVNRYNAMALTPGWDGFASTFSNMKIYQTITLPAGNYEIFVQKAQDWSGASGAYLVINKGTGLPDIENLSTAIGYSNFSSGIAGNSYLVSVAFKLTEETKVSVGCVASFTSAKQSVTIAQFVINQIVGANYSSLSQLVTEAKAYNSVTYPIGTVNGTYPKEKWDALQSAIASSQALIDNGQNTQEEVDASRLALSESINDLNASLKLPFTISDENVTQWYQIRDKRTPNNYWVAGSYISTDGLVFFPFAIIMTNDSNSNDDAQLFKIVKAPAPAKGYYLYNKMVEVPITGSPALNKLVVDYDGTLGYAPTSWIFGTTAYASNYRVFNEGNMKSQLNSYKNQSPNFWGYWYPGVGVDDLGNDMEFIPVVEAGQVNFNNFNTLVTQAQRMTEELYPTGTNEYDYSINKWSEFSLVRDQAIAYQAVNSKATQEQVDSAYNVLLSSINDFISSQLPGFFESDATHTYWYTIHDSRSTNNHWRIGDFKLLADTANVGDRLTLLRGFPVNVTDSLQFKFVKAQEPLTGYYIYSKLNENRALSADTISSEKPIFISPSANPSDWMRWKFVSSTNISKASIIQIEGAPKMKLNSYMSSATRPDYISFYDNSSDVGNIWKLSRVIVNGMNNSTADNSVRVFVINNKITSDSGSDILEVYNIFGQRQLTNHDLPAGVYIVRIPGQIKITKVLIK